MIFYHLILLSIRVPPKYEKLFDLFANWGKVVPWLVLWKNGFNLIVALKLWSRRAAQFLRNRHSIANSDELTIL